MADKKKLEKIAMKAEELRKLQLHKALQVTQIQIPAREKLTLYPREYSKFLEEIKQKPVTWYEKACFFAERILPINPSPKMRLQIDGSIKTSYLNVSAKGVLSLTMILTTTVLFFIFIGIALGIGLFFSLFGFMFAGGVFWYFYNYPSNQAKIITVKMSADTVLAVLYMIIYMRTSPNLEGAIKFSAQNLEGPLAWDLRKLLWDVEVGVYPSADAAFINYIYKWKDKNKEFSEALHLLRGTAVEPGRREMLFEEIINVILNGTLERTKHYAANLRMPVALIHALGVLLPVMGLVFFPIVLIFISDSIKPSFVFFAYDILLPAFLYFIINYFLNTKPPTFSQPDISRAKNVPEFGKFAIGKAQIPIWPISLLIGLPMVSIGFLNVGSDVVFNSVIYSILITFGISSSIFVYVFLDSYQKLKIRKDIERIENELSTALFQLGNSLGSGIPIELAIDKARENLKNLKISDLFEIVSLNMKKFGLTFEQALFDKEIGAIWYYPSRLLHSIMQAVIESSKKSVKNAADSMVVISRYLKGVHDVKEQIDEILGETVSSMQFLAVFLAPLVAGITVTMAVVILQILTRIGSVLGGLLAQSGTSSLSSTQTFLLVPWALGGTPPISPAEFQLIVGIYFIQTAILLSVFINGIRFGEDVIGLRRSIAITLLIGVIVYFLTWFITYSLFAGSLESILTPTGVST